MLDNNFDATIYYKSNCNYHESIVSKDISLPLQTPSISLNIISPQTNEDVIYYGDTLIFKATIKHKTQNNEEKNVMVGEVTFYYVEDSDALKIPKQINSEPIEVDQNGNAGIKYIPHDSGVVIATYSGEPYFETVSTDDQTYRIDLNKRPTSIRFIENSGVQLINPEDVIKLSVQVVDEKTQESIDYGVVTFLNYHGHDISATVDGEEKVIGNPVFLDKNGVATIDYSPIQSANDNELLKNIELIRAVYNYDNQIYGVDWKYYDSHSDYTAIAITQPGMLNMQIPENLNVGEGGLYYLDQGENLLCSCMIKTTDNETITDARVMFTLLGNNDYERNIEVTSATNDGLFVANFANIPSGLFILSAKVNNAKILEEEVE